MKKSRARPRRPAPRPLELSAGAQPGDVRLTAFANARVFIENHSGIIEFDDAHVRVAARREASRALAGVMGCETAAMDALYIAVKGMSAVFNTVPARVIDERTLLNMDAGAIIVETASAPYGVDFESARALGVRVLKEGGIPGRYCPRTAAAIILDAIERDAAKSEGGIENG